MNLYLSQARLAALQPIIYPAMKDVWIYFLAVIILYSLAVYAWTYRRNPAALYMSIGIANIAVWMLAIVIITISPALADKLLWVKIELMSSIAITPTVLLFAVHLTRQRIATIRAVRVGTIVLTVLLWLVLWTNDWHGWIQRDIIWDGITFGFMRGPLYWGIMASAYFALVTILVLYIRQMVKTAGLLYWQALMVLLLMVLAVVGHASWLSKQTNPISLIPLGFMFSLVWAAISFGLHIFNLQELAQATVTHEMRDGMIVIDAQGYIVELNPAAQRLFGEQIPCMIGSRFAEAFAFAPELAELAACRESKQQEICFEFGCCLNDYDIHVVPLKGWKGWRLGKTIVLHDISEQKKAQAQILDQQKALTILTERGRLGREIHDGTGQLWSYMNMQVEAARSLLNKKDWVNADLLLEKLTGIIQDVHVDIRESITGLKLAVAGEHGIWNALDDYLQWFEENYEIHTELAISKEFAAGLLLPTTEVQLLRMIQEALTNIRKHAGAQQVKVMIRLDGGVADIRVEDDGCGFRMADAAQKKDSFGLKIMAERAAEIGAGFQIQSRPGAGTKIILQVPLPVGKELP